MNLGFTFEPVEASRKTAEMYGLRSPDGSDDTGPEYRSLAEAVREAESSGTMDDFVIEYQGGQEDNLGSAWQVARQIGLDVSDDPGDFPEIAQDYYFGTRKTALSDGDLVRLGDEVGIYSGDDWLGKPAPEGRVWVVVDGDVIAARPEEVSAYTASRKTAWGTGEVRIEHSEMYDTWVVYEADGKTLGVFDTEDEARGFAQKQASKKETSMRTEAELLQAMAKATSLEEQRRLMADLEALRRAQRQAAQDSRDLDLADTFVRDTLTPVRTHEHHTAATDWINEIPTSGLAYDHPQRVEATRWYQKLHAEVKADREELKAQAEGMARRTAGQYGEQAQAAYQAFMDTVAHLYSKTAEDEGGQTCATCGDSIARDPEGEEPRTWHHDNGESHDHEAEPKSDSKESRRRKADLNSLSPEEFAAEQARVVETYTGRRVADPTTVFNGSDRTRREGTVVAVEANVFGGNPLVTVAWDDGAVSTHGLAAVVSLSSKRRKTAEDAKTCEVCGDSIERDPKNEDPQTWHHNNGEKHDHEAKPKSDSKESRRQKTATTAYYFVQVHPYDLGTDDAGFEAQYGVPYTGWSGEDAMYATKEQAEAARPAVEAEHGKVVLMSRMVFDTIDFMQALDAEGSRRTALNAGDRVFKSDGRGGSGWIGTVTEMSDNVALVTWEGDGPVPYATSWEPVEDLLAAPNSRYASRRTAGIYCKTHQVWVGDENADTHSRDSCKKEQRATEKTKESRRRTAMVCTACPGGAANPSAHCGGCGQHVEATLTGKWAGVMGMTACPAHPSGTHQPKVASRRKRAFDEGAIDQHVQDTINATRCPNCGSDNYGFYSGEGANCRDCGHHWWPPAPYAQPTARRKTAEEMHRCPSCSFVAPKANILTNHMVTWHGEKRQSRRVTADDKPGKVDKDQSGNAESQVTDYDTEEDQEPFLAEDWDDDDDMGHHPPMPGASGSDVDREAMDSLARRRQRITEANRRLQGRGGASPKGRTADRKEARKTAEADAITVTVTVTDNGRKLKGEWHGGAYIELTFGDVGKPTEVDNVWDYATDSTDIPFTEDGLRSELLAWIRTQDEENPGWYDQYLENAKFGRRRKPRAVKVVRKQGGYIVVNSDTEEVLSEPFLTVEEADAEMYRLFPVVEPWDGVDVPIAVADENFPWRRKSRKTAAEGPGSIGDRRKLTLPYSEVCMHMRVAGETMIGELVGPHAVQLYTLDGQPFSFPITAGEAGWGIHGFDHAVTGSRDPIYNPGKYRVVVTVPSGGTSLSTFDTAEERMAFLDNLPAGYGVAEIWTAPDATAKRAIRIRTNHDLRDAGYTWDLPQGEYEADEATNIPGGGWFVEDPQGREVYVRPDDATVVTAKKGRKSAAAPWKPQVGDRVKLPTGQTGVITADAGWGNYTVDVDGLGAMEVERGVLTKASRRKTADQQKAARDVQPGDQIASVTGFSPTGVMSGTVASVDTTTSPGTVYINFNGSEGPPADLILNHGDPVYVTNAATFDQVLDEYTEWDKTTSRRKRGRRTR